MIDLDIWECRERHISVRHSVWSENPGVMIKIWSNRYYEKEREKSNRWLCLASHARILSHAWYVWWVMLKDELHSVPFLTTLDGKSALKGDLYFFFFPDGDVAVIQNVQSLQYIRKDVMVISVPYECPTWEIIVFISCTVWHHIYYDYLGQELQCLLKLSRLLRT